MRAWQKLEKHSAVNGQIAANSEAPECRKTAYGCEVGRACCDETEYASDAKGHVESPFAAKHIATKTPEDGPSEKTNVLGQ